MFEGLKSMQTHLWEGTIVPEIALVWEAVANETKLALLDILLDWVEEPVICLVSVMNVVAAWLNVLILGDLRKAVN